MTLQIYIHLLTGKHNSCSIDVHTSLYKICDAKLIQCRQKNLYNCMAKKTLQKILISLLLIAPAKNIVSDKRLTRLKTSKSLLFLGEVFLGAPDRNFFLVPSLVAIMLPTFLVDSLPFLRLQHLRL